MYLLANVFSPDSSLSTLSNYFFNISDIFVSETPTQVSFAAALPKRAYFAPSRTILSSSPKNLSKFPPETQSSNVNNNAFDLSSYPKVNPPPPLSPFSFICIENFTLNSFDNLDCSATSQASAKLGSPPSSPR